MMKSKYNIGLSHLSITFHFHIKLMDNKKSTGVTFTELYGPYGELCTFGARGTHAKTFPTRSSVFGKRAACARKGSVAFKCMVYAKPPDSDGG
jgi:hypothetical protein